MKTFGEQKHCTLDSFKPYQRPKLSDGGHEACRLQQERDAAVRCSAWLGRWCDVLMCVSAKQSSQHRKRKQCDGYVAEKQKGTEAVRLLAKRDDLLSCVPRERETHCNVVAAEARGNGGDNNRDNHKKSPFEGGAHRAST
jgi:hypothetical protein